MGGPISALNDPRPLNGYLLTIDDLRNDSLNPSCLTNRRGFQYEDSLNSSLILLAGSLQSNRIYQFRIQMENIYDSSQKVIGYVFVNVQGFRPPMIIVGCVVVTMCSPNLEFQFVNPTTQVSVFSLCIGNCSSIQQINWKVYWGEINSSQWNLFNQTENWFFGRTTSNFTSTNQLFINHPEIKLWKFEVMYSFANETSISSLNFEINQPPRNGSCLIWPLNGTTTTSFQISCSNWFDEDEIKDFSLYVSTKDSKEKLFIAFSSVSTFEVRLPAGLLLLTISIRDQLNSLTEFNLSSVTVRPDSVAINDLLANLQNSNNPIVELLENGNQNTIGQILTSFSQQLNQINSQNIHKASANGIPSATISISSLGTQRLSTNEELNESALIEFLKDLNSQANLREYLISFTKDLSITTSNSIKLQSSTLSQLTKSTNELTRKSLTLAAEKCFELSEVLFFMARKVSFEDVEMAAKNLVECASNVLIGVNGPLQKRTKVLESDFEEFEWSKINLSEDENTFSQKQLANRIANQVNEILSKITSIFEIHMNVDQQMKINSSAVFMFLQSQSILSLTNQNIEQVSNSSIIFPSAFQSNSSLSSKVLVRSTVEPLAVFGQSESSSNTNLSTSVSFSIVDQNGKSISIKTEETNPIEIFIPRDPNLQIPPMILQNVTNLTEHKQLFNLHYVNLTTNLSISVHFEFRSLDWSLCYLLVYKFDGIPQLNSSLHQIDGWTTICPSNENISTFFLDNQRTRGHRSVVFGLRKLNSNESSISFSNPPIINQRFHFTSNYQLRIYLSGCYFLDENFQWKDEGLRVGPLTNHFQTQCFSTHL